MIENKSSIDEIRQRFDKDVERFSNVETGQTATIDAPLAMELITQAAYKSTKKIQSVLDIGCGAGNNTIKLSSYVSIFDCDLVDLSLPMLKRAQERISELNSGNIRIFQGDFRSIDWTSYARLALARLSFYTRIPALLLSAQLKQFDG